MAETRLIVSPLSVLCGRYILKPQTGRFAHLPELEDLTMHLAELAKMQVVPHSLIRFAAMQNVVNQRKMLFQGGDVWNTRLLHLLLHQRLL